MNIIFVESHVNITGMLMIRQVHRFSLFGVTTKANSSTVTEVIAVYIAQQQI